jgi:LytS/YehU family sensor histidine kinase
MDYPTYMQLKAKDLALISVFSAVCIVVGYGKDVALASFPGLVEFMTVLIFVGGLLFGYVVGALIGAISMTVYMLIPYAITHPAAFLTMISPVLLTVMIGLGALFGYVGGLLGKRYTPMKINSRLLAEMALWGFMLTFFYDVMGSVGFYIAYPIFYTSVWEAIYLTFIPLYLPYPPIIHTFTNTMVFAFLVPPLVKALRNCPGIRT